MVSLLQLRLTGPASYAITAASWAIALWLAAQVDGSWRLPGYIFAWHAAYFLCCKIFRHAGYVKECEGYPLWCYLAGLTHQLAVLPLLLAAALAMIQFNEWEQLHTPWASVALAPRKALEPL